MGGVKPLSIQEMQGHVQELEEFLDGKVQKIFCSEYGLGLEILFQKKQVVLWFEISPHAPSIFIFEKLPQFIKLKKSSPIQLFLKAHLIGKRFSEISWLKEYGRVVVFKFGYEEPLSLEVRLIPHAGNIIARCGEGNSLKQISTHKLREMESFQTIEDKESGLSIYERTQKWVLENLKKGESQTKDPLEEKEKAIQKKKNALEKIKSQIEELEKDSTAAIGEWLKTHQKLDIPDEFKKWIDYKKGLSWNIQNVFKLNKKVKEKLNGARQRLQELQKEIHNLEKASIQSFLPQEKKVVPKSKKADSWKGYRFWLNDKVEVFVGRNAQENIEILRYAQSWDIWMHLKDYPGAHGIIRRPRNLDISDEDLKKVAQFVASKSKKSLHSIKSGDTFEVFYTDCRYVRPIKGDKLGRVSYSNEKVLFCRM